MLRLSRLSSKKLAQRLSLSNLISIDSKGGLVKSSALFYVEEILSLSFRLKSCMLDAYLFYGKILLWLIEISD